MIGSKLAHYEITGHLGSGGMGDVYLATDSKLGRSVAIKLLPGAFAGDSERVVRFEREARVLASLNHPNIAAIYGLEHSEGHSFLVMELVDGKTLADRIQRGAIPLDEALAIAKQIAEALEAAHEKGIVHRDLKPANINISADGRVKVLDFGLAKAISGAAEAPNIDVSNSPTMMSIAGTNAGVILGTAAYMSPEQARGRAIDKRTDIFAFGCVLFEMLTGRRAFEGDDIADILSRVLQRDPDWTLLPQATPPAIRKLLALCLEKNAKNRRSDAADIRIDIDLAQKEPAVAASTTSLARSKLTFALMAIATVFALAFASVAIVHFREAPQAAPAELRLDVATPPTTSPLSFALSPDGGSIVFVASGASEPQLWLRRLDQTDAHPLAGTEGASNPFWSPDGKSIGFLASAVLKRIDASGGAAVQLSPSIVTSGATWSTDGVILFSGGAGMLFRIPASGGQATAVFDDGFAKRWPEFLPDGRRFLFYATMGATGGREPGIYVASLDDTGVKRLGPSDTGAKWLPPDRILYIQQNRLFARRLDLNRNEFIGDPEPVAESVGTGGIFQGGFSVSANGRIAYRAGGSVSTQQLVWLDRSGKKNEKPADAGMRDAVAPELSPDGKRLALDRIVQVNRDVWLMDLVRGGMTRFTFDAVVDGYPIWSPDGTQIAFETARKGTYDIYVKASNNAGVEQPLWDPPGNQWPMSFSKDGKFLLYYNGSNSGDLLVVPVSGNDRKPIPVATTPFLERTGTFSPDGKWVAYDTTESGRSEVVVQAFPNPGGKWQASTAGGSYPRWNADGKELYFISANKMMAASIRSSGVALDIGTPIELFQMRFAMDGTAGGRPPYDVTRDGRFIVNQLLETSTTSPITILLNWKPAR